MSKYRIVEEPAFKVETTDGKLIGSYLSRKAAEERIKIAERRDAEERAFLNPDGDGDPTLD